jgi:hypothetical protein
VTDDLLVRGPLARPLRRFLEIRRGLRPHLTPERRRDLDTRNRPAKRYVPR